MPRYSVIVTRNLTESIQLEVQAPTRAEADEFALDMVYESTFDPAHPLHWEVDEGNFSKPYIGDPGQAEELES